MRSLRQTIPLVLMAAVLCAGTARAGLSPAAEKGASSTPSAPSPGKGKAAKPGKEPASAASPSVEIYTTSWCGYCRQARAYLQSRGIPFTEYDVERDAAAARRFQEMNPTGGIPFAVINGRRLLGFSEDAYAQALAPR